MRAKSPTLLVASLTATALAGCTAAPTYGPTSNLYANPNAAYAAAVADARVVEPSEIRHTLTAIRKDDPDQYWSNDGVDDHVLMTTWTNWRGFDKSVGESLDLANDVWVTAAPQLKRFCEATPEQGGALTLRIRQLLGLPPEANRTRVVDLWVKPGDMFRPTPDPEITDNEAEPDFPVSPRSAVSPAHKHWFETLKGVAYDKGRRTWTRLGYTYDWGNPVDHVGLSEFVIHAGATVVVHSVSSLETYCGRR